MNVQTILLTEEQYETLLFLFNGLTTFVKDEITSERLKKFLGKNVYIESNTEVIHFVK